MSEINTLIIIGANHTGPSRHLVMRPGWVSCSVGWRLGSFFGVEGAARVGAGDDLDGTCSINAGYRHKEGRVGRWWPWPVNPS